MGKNLYKMIAVMMAIGLTFSLAGAGCAQKTPTSEEMDFTSSGRRAKEEAEATTFWKNDTPYVVVQMTKDNQFSPKEIKVPAGRSIMWQNSSTEKHVVAADENKWLLKSAGINTDGDGGLVSQSVSPKKSWRWQIPKDAKSGTKIYYHCALHGEKGDGKSFGTGMIGVIIVK